ncbi:ribonuclease HII [Marchantia polymorpha subsp. ruderalis]|uniref:Ribonuclease n=1 Tax=Marchantia polymorpha TaxID=3197 RepID=A0A2R6XCN5_MARPO|nr:hypothetical protein MARPO_0023s0164 [Marchantia polymorpha]BBN02009.1 hypothetical protein Mp_2g11990 [Marchantia polymorpha subsp. ruderalis]|eukprot:PTQ43871.1 hypothetical protein MARPO_0023s0164 [Marchantia polymorpha]
MAAPLLRRSSRLAAAASAVASSKPERVVSSLKPKKASASFVKKSGNGAKKVTEEDDSRSGNSLRNDSREADHAVLPVLKVETAIKPHHKEGKLKKKMPSREMEAQLWDMGFQHVAGVDEAGRGPLAGPVVAAACIIPSSVNIEGIDDSKKLTEAKREELYEKITSTPGISYAIHVVDAAIIDEVNILQATMQAMSACVQVLSCASQENPRPDFILVDGNRLPDGFPENSRSVVKGDAVCQVIAAASILAKVTRDRLMLSYDKTWPNYGFKAHKGYGTATHMAALLKYGPCDIHRRSFAPLKGQRSKTSDTL